MFDLLGSVKPNNVITMLAAGAKNMPLTKYLIQQVMLSKEQRMEELREFIPNAKSRGLGYRGSGSTCTSYQRY